MTRIRHKGLCVFVLLSVCIDAVVLQEHAVSLPSGTSASQPPSAKVAKSDSSAATYVTTFSGSVQSGEALEETWPYVWNRTIQKAADFLLEYCTRRCDVLETVGSLRLRRAAAAVRTECKTLKCFPCQCFSSCHVFSSCCPGYGPPIAGDFEDLIGCLPDRTISMSIVRCPSEWTGNETETCAREPDPMTVEIPVSDKVTGITYKNEHCAVCNYVTSYKPYTLKAFCDTFQYFHSATSEEEILAMAKLLPDICTLRLIPPEGVESRGCDRRWHRNVTTVCNVTGRWERHDRDVEANCFAFQNLHYRVWSPEHNATYGNLFCAMCNGVEPKFTTKCNDSTGEFEVDTGIPITPYTLLFGLKSRKPQAKSGNANCLRSQWNGLKDECRNISCHVGKILNNTNNTCQTAIPEIRGLVYKFTMTLKPMQTRPHNSTGQGDNCTTLIAAIQSEFIEKTSGLVSHYILTVDVLNGNSSTTLCDPMDESDVRLSGQLTASVKKTRDKVEESLVANLLMADWTVSMTATDKVVLHRSSDIFSTEITDQYIVFTKTFVYDGGEDFGMSTSFKESQKIDLLPSLVCAFVEFDISEIEIIMTREDKGDRNAILRMNGHEVEVNDVQNACKTQDKIRICFEALGNTSAVKRLRTEVGILQYVMSVVAISLSVACLALTLFVYFLLPPLRTQPGLNVMGTCIALAVAQIAVLFASNNQVTGFWCVSLGIILHFTWLSTFCWTAICSVHMFRAFSAKTYITSTNRYTNLALNVVITTIIPSLVVMLVVLTSPLYSEGDSIGYGKYACYLDSPFLVGVGVVLPISAVVVFNLVLFGLTVHRISQVRKLHTNANPDKESELQQCVYVCVRLSVLTGAMWGLSLLAEGLDLEWLRYISILANGGQGVLVFISYVTTRRVLTMLSLRLGVRCGDSWKKSKQSQDSVSPSVCACDDRSRATEVCNVYTSAHF